MSQASTELIGSAWDAAQAANLAFDRMREAEAGLAALQLVGSLGLREVTIGDGAYTELETRRSDAETEFHTKTDEAAPLMLIAGSPFGAEAILKHGPPARSLQEIKGFGTMRGYSLRFPMRIFTALSPAATIEDAPNLELYLASAPEAPGGLTLIRLEGAGFRPKKDQEGLWGIDIRGLQASVTAWLQEDPRIPELGERGISFLADYLNHACSDLETPFPVKYPPTPPQQA